MMNTGPNFFYWFKRLFFDLLKGSAAALAGMIGMMLGGMAAALVGLPAVGVPAYMDIARVMPLMFLSAKPIAVVLGECFRRLYASYGLRLFFIFLANYILYYLLNLLDGFIFSPLPNMSTAFFADIFPAFFSALVIAALWRPGAEQASPVDRQNALLPRYRRAELAWRVALAWLAYLPIYYLIGLVVGQFTKSYYLDPSHRLGLALPPLAVILVMQIARGGLFLLAVLPVIGAWRGSRIGLWLWTGSLIFLQIAATVLFQAYWLPAAVRIPHVLELLVDSFLQAGVYVLVLAPAVKTAVRQGSSIQMPSLKQPAQTNV